MGNEFGDDLGRKRTAHWVGMRALLPTVGLALAACTHHPDEGTVVKPGDGVKSAPGGGQKIVTAPARPIMGGTLTTSRDGTIAVASDPDRDTVFVVELARRTVSPIQLEAGEVPGRVAMGSGANAYVVLREAAALLHIDLDGKRIIGRYAVCDAPRGVAFDATAGLVHVACQGGTLVSLDADHGEVVRQVRVADDLRDVVVSGEHLVLTTFRGSRIVVLNADGEIVQQTAPATLNGFSVPSVAWRAVAGPAGEVRIVHQMADTGSGVSTQNSGYGGGDGACSMSIVRPAVTTFTLGATAQGTVTSPIQLLGAAGPTDIAIAPSGRIAVVVAGNARTELAAVRRFEPLALTDDCTPAEPSEGEPVAVAFDANGHTVVQSREPAALYLENGEKITLSSESRANTGHSLFHMNTGAGIACASCHPEGTDDAQTWNFVEIGWRRSQSVAGGISRRAPYHWQGDMENFEMLVEQVMVGRMSLPSRPNELQTGAFLGWLDSVERPHPRFGDPEAVTRGETLFFDATVGCNDCHTGPELTNKRTFDVGTNGAFVVPSLLGIASRAPFMHDGCAPTLRERFSACGGGDRHGQTSHLSDSQIDDLVAYLETL